jgi:hypothetical protein
MTYKLGLTNNYWTRFLSNTSSCIQAGKQISILVLVNFDCTNLSKELVLHVLADLITINVFGWNVFFMKIKLIVTFLGANFSDQNAVREKFCTRFVRSLHKQNSVLCIDKIFETADTWHVMYVVKLSSTTHPPTMAVSIFPWLTYQG